jgi:hypothetical protein
LYDKEVVAGRWKPIYSVHFKAKKTSDEEQVYFARALIRFKTIFYDTARYVSIRVTGLPSGANASFYDFKVFGTVDGPTVFKDTNYGGTSVALGSGTYTLAQMQAEGIADNSISSIQVPSGYTVIAYVGGTFDGTTWTFTSDNSSLVIPATTI